MNGYLKLWRSLAEHPLWTSVPDAWFRVALGCLLRANFKASKWWDGSRQVEIPAGSFVTSRDKMSAFCRVSPKQYRLAVSYLEKTEFLGQQRASKYTVITVRNWATYQSNSEPEGQQRADKGPDKGQVGATDEEVKKLRSQETTIARPSDSLSVKADADASFDREFWPQYPKKVAKEAARRAYRKVASSETARRDILDGLKWHLPDLSSRELQFIPHAATWLNQRRWNDEPQGRNGRASTGQEIDGRRSGCPHCLNTGLRWPKNGPDPKQVPEADWDRFITPCGCPAGLAKRAQADVIRADAG